MNTKKFDSLTKKILVPILCNQKGYTFDKGVFFLTTETQLRKIITLDYDLRGKKTYRVMVGVNSVEVDDGFGLYYLKYFTGGSLSDSPRDIPCFNMEKAEENLIRLRNHLDSLIFPFLEAINTPLELADRFTSPNLGKYKEFFISKITKKG